MTLIEKQTLQSQYEELVHKKIAYLLHKLPVPESLNIQIKRLAQILGLNSRYGEGQNFLYKLSKALK